MLSIHFASLSLEILISSNAENRNLRKKTNKLSCDFVKKKEFENHKKQDIFE